jgi:hypothetical protein
MDMDGVVTDIATAHLWAETALQPGEHLADAVGAGALSLRSPSAADRAAPRGQTSAT